MITRRCKKAPVSEAQIVKCALCYTTHLSMFKFVVVVIRHHVDVSRTFPLFKHQSHVHIEIEGLDLHVDNTIL